MISSVMVTVDSWWEDMLYFYHKECYKGDGVNAYEEDPKDYYNAWCAACGKEIAGE